jgi:hypothetical protein
LADREQARSGRDRDQAAAWADHDLAEPARADSARAESGRDRDQDQAAQPAEAFRLPLPGEHGSPARSAAPGPAPLGESTGDDFWDRVSEELETASDHDPVRPAWPATAGPRAMGGASAPRHAPEVPGDAGAEPSHPAAGFAPPEPVPPRHEAAPFAPGPREPEPGEEPAAAGSHRGVFVPRAADDETRTPERSVARRFGSGEDAPERGGPNAAGPAAAESAESAVTGTATADGAAAESAVAGGDLAGAELGGGDEGDLAPAAEVPTEDRDRAGDTGPEPGTDGTGDAGPGDGRPAPGAPGDTAETGHEGGGAAGADTPRAAPTDDEVTIVPGIARYHRRGCILIRFLSDGDLEIMTRGAAEATGSVPCKACQPDKPASAG